MPNLVRKLISAIIRVNTTNQRQKIQLSLLFVDSWFPFLILIKISPQRYRITNPRLACRLQVCHNIANFASFKRRVGLHGWVKMTNFQS